MQVSTIGVDLAKNVFQVHGVDNAGKVVITRQLRRKQARAPGAAPASRADGRLGQRPLSFAGLLRFRITPRGTKRCSSSGLVVRGASRSSLPLWLSSAKPSEEHRGRAAAPASTF